MALGELPVRVLVTVGERTEASGIGRLPGNVRVERWVPQAQVLGHAAAMVCHGGFGTVLGGLYAGVPMVLAPMFADQPRNAARVAELGAGIVLGRGARGAERIGAALRDVLDDHTYASAARASPRKRRRWRRSTTPSACSRRRPPDARARSFNEPSAPAREPVAAQPCAYAALSLLTIETRLPSAILPSIRCRPHAGVGLGVGT